MYKQRLWRIVCSLECSVGQLHCNHLRDEVQAHGNLFCLYYKPGLAYMLLFACCIMSLVGAMLSETFLLQYPKLAMAGMKQAATGMVAVLRCGLKSVQCKA